MSKSKTRKSSSSSPSLSEAAVHPLRLEYRSPEELAENPANWRRHPESQVASLTDVIAEVGWAGACLFNEQTGRLIDGHARRKVALEQGCERIPVLIGSWDEATEKKILATLDPLATMAEADASKLDTLLREVSTDSAALQEMLADLAAKSGVVSGEESAVETADWPEINATQIHTITLKYGPEDETAIKAFVGQLDDGPLEPIHTGAKILERIKAATAD